MHNAWQKRPYANSGRRNIRDNLHLLYADPLTIQQDDDEHLVSDRGIPDTPKSAADLPNLPKQVSKERRQLTVKEVAKLRERFEAHSTVKTIKKPPRSRLNANGVREVMYSEPEVDISLSEKELQGVFESAGIPLSKQTLSHIYSQMHPKHGKGVTIEQFEDIVNHHYGGRDEEQYQPIFKLYDRKSRGYFDLTDYKYVCAGIAKTLTQAQMESAFSKLDKEGTGKINLTRFIEVMKFMVE